MARKRRKSGSRNITLSFNSVDPCPAARTEGARRNARLARLRAAMQANDIIGYICSVVKSLCGLNGTMAKGEDATGAFGVRIVFPALVGIFDRGAP